MRGEGFDASEDGTGRGTPLVPVAFAENSRAELRLEGGDGQTTGTLSTGGGKAGQGVPMIAFSCKDHGADAGELSPTLRAMGHGASHPNAGGQVAVAFNWQSGGDCRGLDLQEQEQALTRQQTPATLHGSAVRRLMPVECERLQGFPTVTELLRIDVCIDRQSNSAAVALSCRKWQNSASPAAGNGWLPPASAAAQDSATSPASPAPLAALHVLTGCAPSVQVRPSRARSTPSASGADQSEAFRPTTPPDAIAHALARLTHDLAKTALPGKAASPASIRLSFPVASGSKPVTPSGDAMAGSADDAASAPSAATFTTSDLGRLTPSSGTTTETSCCSALAAIAGCIPSETLPERFSLEVSVESEYTAIPWRGKPASECPDGPRYKALGNSWAVPCARWIGKRIQRAIP